MLFSLAALATFTTAMVFVSYISPFYFDDTFFTIKSGEKLTFSYEYLVTQWREYILIYLPLVTILAAFLAHRCYLQIFLSVTHRQDLLRKNLVRFFDIDAPSLLLNPNYIWIFGACSTLIISLSLGKHLGNYLFYFFQLISPFLLVGVFALISGMPKWQGT